jgi:hypothetical protein
LKIANASRNQKAVQQVGARDSPRDRFGHQDERHEEPQRHPKATVGRERGGAEDVAVPEFPHPGEELGEAAVEEGEPEPRHVRNEGRVVTAQD